MQYVVYGKGKHGIVAIVQTLDSSLILVDHNDILDFFKTKQRVLKKCYIKNASKKTYRS